MSRPAAFGSENGQGMRIYLRKLVETSKEKRSSLCNSDVQLICSRCSCVPDIQIDCHDLLLRVANYIVGVCIRPAMILTLAAVSL